MIRRDAGFTLLEILAALVVLGFIAAGLAQGTRFGVRALSAQGRLINERADLAAVDRTLRRLIERMEPGGLRQPPRFQGDAHRLAFTSVLPEAAAAMKRRADMMLLVDGTRLMLHWTPTQRARPTHTETELLRGVSRVEFAYWSRDGAWMSVWSERTLPSLVRIRIVFVEGDRRHWPDIVAAPLQEQPGA